MPSNEDYVRQLSNVPLFSNCSRKEIALIGKLATSLFVESDSTFIEEGGFAREMMVIVSGSAKVVKAGVTVAELGPGAVVGELALLTGHPRNATVTSTSRSEILVLDSGAFSTLLDAVPSVTRAVLNTVAKRLSEAELPKV